MKRNILTFSLLAFIGISTFAQEKPRRERPTPEQVLDRFDSNNDGLISETEAQAEEKLNRHFNEIDASQDGYISLVELKEAKEKRGKKDLKKIDTDQDGQLSYAEVEASGKQKLIDKFSAIDANKDGYLEKSELKAFKQNRREKE